MQHAAPLLIRGRLAKADRVVFETAPVHEQHITIRYLDAASQLVRDVAGHACDNRCRAAKCGFEFFALCRSHVQNCDFENWFAITHAPPATRIYKSETPDERLGGALLGVATEIAATLPFLSKSVSNLSFVSST